MEINNLELNLTAETGKAMRSLTSLLGALERIDAIKGNGIKRVINQLERLAAVDFNNLKVLKNTLNQVNKLAGVENLPKLSNLAKPLSDARGEAETFANAVDKSNLVMENMSEVTEKTATNWAKLTRSFVRIAFYRTVRMILKEITQAFREGRQELVKHSVEANKVMSNLLNTGNQLKNTLGVTFVSTMKALEPVIMLVANAVIDLANGVNMLLAKLNGQTTFMRAIKQNEDYAESLEKVNAQLFSFDKFEVLSGDKQAANPFEEVEIGKGFSTGVNLLVSALTTLVALKVYDWAVKCVAGLQAMTVGTNALTVASNLLRTAGLFLLIFAILELVMRWDELDTKMKAIYITLAVLGAALILLSNTTILKTVIVAIVAFIGHMQLTMLTIKEWILHNQLLVGSLAGIVAGIAAFFILDNFMKDMDNVTKIIAGVIVALAAGTAAWIAFHSASSLGVKTAIALAAVGAGVAGVKAIFSGIQGQIRGYADGGAITEDGLFQLTKGEITGQFKDGSTFVANQQQGQEGLRQAAYEGFMAAIESVGGFGNSGSNYDYIPASPSGLYEIVRREGRRRGDL